MQAIEPGDSQAANEVTPNVTSGGTWLRENLSKIKKKSGKDTSLPLGASMSASSEGPKEANGKEESSREFSSDFISLDADVQASAQKPSDPFTGDFISFEEPGGKKRKAETPETPPVQTATDSQKKKAKTLAAFVDRRSPWSRGQSYQSNTGDATVDLHVEILDFVAFISPTRQEIKRRTTLVELFESIISDLWPAAVLKVFGSYATGMYLPSSDIDMVVMGCNDAMPLQKIAKIIRADGNFDKIQVIDKAKVPIIKFEDVPSGIPLNICIGQEDGLKNTEWVKEQKSKYPALAPLLLVAKQFLYNRDLHETYTGGIGSYLLTMTIISHLQHHPGCGPEHKTADSNLGALLVDYVHLYGLRFNMEDIGISVRHGGSFFRKKSKGWVTSGRPFLLSVEDPNNPDSDLGKNSYNIRNVQRAFELAFYSLVVRDRTQTPLGSILQWDQRWDSAFAEHRLARFKRVKGPRARDTSRDKHAAKPHRRQSDSQLQLHSKKRRNQMEQAFPRRHSAGGKFEYDPVGRLSVGGKGKGKFQSPHAGKQHKKKRKF